MSASFITILPKDPQWIPDQQTQTAAEKALGVVAPNSTVIRSVVSDTVAFYDCGANFEKVSCPFCGSTLDLTWWQQAIDNDCRDEGFTLAKLATPCCHKETTLNDLVYDWEQGFSRYMLEVEEPGIGVLAPKEIQEIEKSLAAKVKVVYRHL